MELEIGFRVTRNVGDINFVSTETEASFFLAAYLPGFTKDEIEVAMREEERQIIIRGRGHITNQESVTTRRLAISREIFFEGFNESFAAPDGIDWGDINAHFDEEEHILIISIPKLTREESLDIGAEEIPGYTIQLGQASEELDSIQDLGDDRNGEYKPKEWKRPEQIEQKEEKEAHKRLPHWSPMGESTDLHLEKEHVQVRAPTDPSQQPKMKEALQSIELAAEHLQLEQEEETAPKQVTPKGKKAMQAAVELQPPKPKGQEQKHLPYKEMEALEDNYHATEEHRKLPERTKDDSSMTVECRETEVPTKEFYPPKQAVQLTSPEKDKPKPPTEPPKEHPQPKAYEERQTPTMRPKDKDLAAVMLPETRECDGQPPEHKYKSSKITMPETRPPPEQEDEKPKLAPIYKEHEVSKLQEKEEPKIEVYKPMEDNLESKHRALKVVTFEEQLTQKSKRPSEGTSYDESETPKSIETKQNHQKPTFIQTKQPGVKEPDEGLEPAKLIQSDILDEEFKRHKLEEREYERSVISPKYDQQPNATELPKEIELLPWLHMHKEDREKPWENLEKKSSETNEKLKSKEISQDLKQEMEQKQKLHPEEVPTFPHPILEVLEQLTPETPTDIMQKLPQFKVQEPRESQQDLTQEKNGQYLPEGIQKIASKHYLQEQYAEIQPSKEQEGKPSLGKKLQEQAKLKDDIYQLKEEEKTPPSKYNEAKHEGIKPVFIERKPYQQEQETQKPTPEQKKKPSIVEPPNVKEQETEEVLTQRELQPREESKEKQKVTLEPQDKSLKMIELKTKEEEQPGFKFQLQEPQEDNSHQPQDRKEKEQPEETCKMPTHKEEITKGIQLPEAAATYTPELNSSALSEEVFAELQQSKQDDAKPPLQPMAVEEQGIKPLFEQQKKEEVPRQIQKSALMPICQETNEKEIQFVVEDGAIVEPIPESRKHDQVEKHLLDKELPTLELMKLEPEHLQKIAEQDYKFRQLQDAKEKEDGQRGKFSLQLTTEDKRKKDPKQSTEDKYELDRTTASQKQQAKLQQEEEEFKPSLGKELPESGKTMQQIFQLEEENLSQPSEPDYMEEPGIETFPKQGAYKKKESKKFQKPEVEPPLEATQRKKQKAQEECEQKLQLQTKGDETKSLEPQQTTEKEEQQRGIPGEHESIFKSEGQFLITQIPKKEDQISPLGKEKHEKTKPKKKAIQLEEVAPAEEPSLLLETSAVSEMQEPLHYEESKEHQKLEVPPQIQAPKRGELIETELPYEAPSSEESFQVKARIEAEPRLPPIKNKLQDKPEVEPSRQLTKTKELIESVRETQVYRPEKEQATETSTPETHQPFTPQKSKDMKVKQLEPQQVGEQPIQLQPFMEGKPTYVVQGKQLVEQPDGEEEEKETTTVVETALDEPKLESDQASKEKQIISMKMEEELYRYADEEEEQAIEPPKIYKPQTISLQIGEKLTSEETTTELATLSPTSLEPIKQDGSPQPLIKQEDKKECDTITLKQIESLYHDLKKPTDQKALPTQMPVQTRKKHPQVQKVKEQILKEHESLEAPLLVKEIEENDQKKKSQPIPCHNNVVLEESQWTEELPDDMQKVEGICGTKKKVVDRCKKEKPRSRGRCTCRSRRQRPSFPLPPSSLFASSAFIFSVMVLVFHFIKKKSPNN